jgi:hypothetical protein
LAQPNAPKLEPTQGAQQVTDAAAKGPLAATLKFVALLEAAANTHARCALCYACAAPLRAIGLAVQNASPQEFNQVFDSLSTAGALAGPSGAKDMAKAFLSGVSRPADVLKRCQTALAAMPPTDPQALFLAEVIMQVQTGTPQITALSGELVSALDEAERTLSQSANLVQSDIQVVSHLSRTLGPCLSPQQVTRAQAALLKSQSADWQAFEAAGARLAALLPGLAALAQGSKDSVVRSHYLRTLGLLPTLGLTQAGKTLLRAAVVNQVNRETSILDMVNDAAAQTKDADAYKDALAQEVTEAIGTQALLLKAADQTAEAASLVEEGLFANAKWIGASGDAFATIVDQAAQLIHAGIVDSAPTALRAEDLIRAVDQRLQSAHMKQIRMVGEEDDPTRDLSRASLCLSSLMVMLRAAGNVNDWMTFQNQNNLEKALTINGGVDVVSASTRVILAALSKSEDDFKTPRAAMSVLNGLTNVLYAYKDLSAAWENRSSSPAKAALLTLSGSGEVTVAGSSALWGVLQVAELQHITKLASFLGFSTAEAIPDIGTIAGAGLVALGVAGGFVLDSMRTHQIERADEASGRAFLMGAGLSDAAATQLARVDAGQVGVGVFTSAVAQRLGVAPAALFAAWAHLPPAMLTDVVNMALSVPYIRDPKRGIVYSDAPTPAGFLDYLNRRPRDLTEAVEWLKQRANKGALPPPP